MGEACEVVIIAALEREIRGLLQGAPRRAFSGTSLRCCSWKNAVIVCAGMGEKAAATTADNAIRALRPGLICSVGFAGALDSSLQVGGIIQPSTIVCCSSGRRYQTVQGDGGLLVSIGKVASKVEKRELRDRYRAIAVDMEAVGVAEQARRHGIPFLAIKAISDDVEASLPEIQRFITRDGAFRTAAFLAYASVHPQIWLPLYRLARDSGIAAAALQRHLRHSLETGEFIRLARSNPTFNSR